MEGPSLGAYGVPISTQTCSTSTAAAHFQWPRKFSCLSNLRVVLKLTAILKPLLNYLKVLLLRAQGLGAYGVPISTQTCSTSTAAAHFFNGRVKFSCLSNLRVVLKLTAILKPLLNYLSAAAVEGPSLGAYGVPISTQTCSTSTAAAHFFNGRVKFSCLSNLRVVLKLTAILKPLLNYLSKAAVEGPSLGAYGVPISTQTVQPQQQQLIFQWPRKVQLLK